MVALAPRSSLVPYTALLRSGFEDASVTFACSAVPNAVLTIAVCGVPDTARIDCGAAAALVSVKLAGVSPVTDALKIGRASCGMAGSSPDVASPKADVTGVTVGLPPKAALAPVAGVVNVPVTLASGFDDASVTFACSALPNAVLTIAVCGVPDTARIDCGAAAALVSVKLAGVSPVTDALTI